MIACVRLSVVVAKFCENWKIFFRIDAENLLQNFGKTCLRFILIANRGDVLTVTMVAMVGHTFVVQNISTIIKFSI